MRVAEGAQGAGVAHSQGRNNGYGGPRHACRGSRIVRLRHMNRVIEMNDEFAYAVVEPGVSWMDLYEAIEAGGPGSGSPAPTSDGAASSATRWIAAAATRRRRPRGRQCGMEVVLANGDVLRTGMGAMANARAAQVYRRGCGPNTDPLFMQSNLGVVTKMGVWLKPTPEALHAEAGSRVRAGRRSRGGASSTRRTLRLHGILAGQPMGSSNADLRGIRAREPPQGLVRWSRLAPRRRDRQDRVTSPASATG